MKCLVEKFIYCRSSIIGPYNSYSTCLLVLSACLLSRRSHHVDCLLPSPSRELLYQSLLRRGPIGMVPDQIETSRREASSTDNVMHLYSFFVLLAHMVGDFDLPLSFLFPIAEIVLVRCCGDFYRRILIHHIQSNVF
jgi:hypothetical protein